MPPNRGHKFSLDKVLQANLIHRQNNNLRLTDPAKTGGCSTGDYHYYAVNLGHGQYKVYQKKPIDPYDDIVDEVLSEMFGRDWKRQWKEIEKSKKNL